MFFFLWILKLVSKKLRKNNQHRRRSTILPPFSQPQNAGTSGGAQTKKQLWNLILQTKSEAIWGFLLQSELHLIISEKWSSCKNLFIHASLDTKSQ